MDIDTSHNRHLSAMIPDSRAPVQRADKGGEMVRGPVKQSCQHLKSKSRVIAGLSANDFLLLSTPRNTFNDCPIILTSLFALVSPPSTIHDCSWKSAFCLPTFYKN
ncbi:hypothetical protein J6590_022589 [Homalodisca vitripennis]|nr:hypothetical protein J6590_022589 [Homalodisca vitripennis]